MIPYEFLQLTHIVHWAKISSHSELTSSFSNIYHIQTKPCHSISKEQSYFLWMLWESSVLWTGELVLEGKAWPVTPSSIEHSSWDTSERMYTSKERTPEPVRWKFRKMFQGPSRCKIKFFPFSNTPMLLLNHGKLKSTEDWYKFLYIPYQNQSVNLPNEMYQHMYTSIKITSTTLNFQWSSHNQFLVGMLINNKITRNQIIREGWEIQLGHLQRYKPGGPSQHPFAFLLLQQPPDRSCSSPSALCSFLSNRPECCCSKSQITWLFCPNLPQLPFSLNVQVKSL